MTSVCAADLLSAVSIVVLGLPLGYSMRLSNVVLGLPLGHSITAASLGFHLRLSTAAEN